VVACGIALALGSAFAREVRAQAAGGPGCERSCSRALRDPDGCCPPPATPDPGVRDAPPCTPAQLAFDVEAEGAAGSVFGTLRARNVSSHACSVAGVPDVRFVDERGRVVQSTDRARVAAAAPPVVLAPGAWARSELGRIASNVCGGDRSVGVVWVYAGARRRIVFRNGGPLHPDGCDAGARRPHAGRHPGELQVQPLQGYPPPAAPVG
jgi:hypothetical protein